MDRDPGIWDRVARPQKEEGRRPGKREGEKLGLGKDRKGGSGRDSKGSGGGKGGGLPSGAELLLPRGERRNEQSPLRRSQRKLGERKGGAQGPADGKPAPV